jgi:hypothetical protein
MLLPAPQRSSSSPFLTQPKSPSGKKTRKLLAEQESISPQVETCTRYAIWNKQAKAQSLNHGVNSIDF